MRFFLLLILFNLSCFNYAFSQKINIENRVILDVPDKFIFIEGNVNSELIEPLLFFVGESPKSYLIGTKESVEFTREYQDNPDDVFQEIVTKMEQKNIKSQSSAEKFVAKELTKLFKKKKYEGVIWLIFGESKIDQIDYEFKEPGEYDFDKTSFIFNQEARTFNTQGFYCNSPFRSKDFIKYWDDQKNKCRLGAIYKNKGEWCI